MGISLSQAFIGVDNSVIEGAVLEHLYNEDITNMMTATVGNPSTVNAGTARVFTGEMLQVNEYKQKGFTTADKIKATEIDIVLDTKREVRWGSETLDNTTFSSAAALEGLIAGSLSKSIMAERVAFLTKATYDAAIALGAFTVDATAHTTTDKDEIRDLYFEFADLSAAFEELFTTKELGVNQERISQLVRPRVKTRLLKETSQAALEGSQRTGDLNQVNGVSIAKMPMFGQNIAKGSSFSKDTDFDFSNIQGLVFATGAMAAPIANLQVSVAIDADGNPNAIAKYIINKGTALRPTLIHAVVQAAPTKDAMVKAFENLKASFTSMKNGEYRDETIKVVEELHKAALAKLDGKKTSKKESKKDDKPATAENAE